MHCCRLNKPQTSQQKGINKNPENSSVCNSIYLVLLNRVQEFKIIKRIEKVYINTIRKHNDIEVHTYIHTYFCTLYLLL